MKNIVLKVPTGLFIVIVLLPLMIVTLGFVSGEELVEQKHLNILSILGSVVSSIWLFSIVDYFQSKAPSFKHARLIYALLATELIISLLQSFNILELDGRAEFGLFILRISVYIISVVFITLLVRKVFYERAVWFIVIEILFVIIGITTLTPEIKRNERELLAQELD